MAIALAALALSGLGDPAGELDRARQLAARGDLAGAITVLEPLRDAAGQQADELTLLGQLYLHTGRIDDALAVLEPLVEDLAAAGKPSPAQRLLGMVRLGRAEHLAAYLQLRPWALAHPDDVDAHLAATFCAVSLERLSEAEELLAGIPVETPRVRLLWGEIHIGKGEYQAAIDLLEPLAAQPPAGLESVLRLHLAHAYVRARQPEKAIELLAGHAAASPQLALLLAEAHHEAGDPEAAVGALSGHMAGDEVPLPVLQDLGRYLVLAGRGEEAIPVLERAVAMDPEHQPSWQFLSRALFAAGRRQEASEATQRMRQLTGRQPTQSEQEVDYRLRIAKPTEYRLREAAALRDGGDLEGALEIVRQEIRLAPADARVRLFESVLLGRLGRPSAALAAAGEALRLEPESPKAYVQRASLYLTLDNLDAAEEDLRRVLELEPEHRAASHQLALVLTRRGDLTTAQRLLEEHLERYPDDSGARENLERIRLQLAGGG